MQFQQVKVYKALKSQRSSPAAVAVQVLFFCADLNFNLILRCRKPQGTWCQAMAALVAMPHFTWRREGCCSRKSGWKAKGNEGKGGGAPNEDRTWLANLLCKRKYGISLPRQCRRRSNRNSFQPAGKKSRTKDSRFSVRDAKVFL